MWYMMGQVDLVNKKGEKFKCIRKCPSESHPKLKLIKLSSIRAIVIANKQWDEIFKKQVMDAFQRASKDMAEE